MTLENCEILQEILSELQGQYDTAQMKINENSLVLQEIEACLNSYFDKEDAEFKFFSPRNVEIIHKDEIDKLYAKKLLCEKENDELILQSDSLKSKINKIEKLLVEEEKFDINMLQIQEEERHRISRDLHDTSLQNLAHLVHKIELSSMYIDEDPLRAKLELSVVNKNLRDIIEEIRNTIFNLRPMTFDDLGLKETIERLLNVINKSKDYEVVLEVEDVSCENNIVLLTLYRVIQESLNNIVKHAQATKIIIIGKHTGNYYDIIIRDNGIGFNKEDIRDKQTNHFGMSLIKERINVLGGTININSECGKGTELIINIPINDDLIIR